MPTRWSCVRCTRGFPALGHLPICACSVEKFCQGPWGLSGTRPRLGKLWPYSVPNPEVTLAALRKERTQPQMWSVHEQGIWHGGP